MTIREEIGILRRDGTREYLRVRRVVRGWKRDLAQMDPVDALTHLRAVERRDVERGAA